MTYLVAGSRLPHEDVLASGNISLPAVPYAVAGVRRDEAEQLCRSMPQVRLDHPLSRERRRGEGWIKVKIRSSDQGRRGGVL